MTDTQQALQAEIDRLQLKVQELQEQLRSQQRIIRQAKDISPVQKPSLKRVLNLIQAPGFNLAKAGCRWVLSFGSTLKRSFKTLREIWEAVNVDDFFLSDLFDPKPHQKAKPLLAASNPSNRLPFQYICVPFADDGSIEIDGSADWGRPPPVTAT
jgi:hypothetical protein